MNSSYLSEFALDDGFIHLNHAAVAPWPRRTVDAITQFAKENSQRGSWDYPHWLETEALLREQLRTLINAPSVDDIALVKNTSEALSFVAAGINWSDGDNIVSSDQEFPSNRIVWQSLAPRGVSLRQADLSDGDSPEDALFSQVDRNTRMIAISSVQYASGIKMDLERLGRFCRDKGILFCIDAIQSIGAHQFDVQTCNADFVAADGHKWMLGPEGLGLFYVRPELRETLALTQYGWHMVEAIGDYERHDWQPASSARRFEAGSPNMLAIHALHASLSLLLEIGMGRVEQLVREKSDRLIATLKALPGVELITPLERTRRAGIVTFSVNGNECEPMQQALQQQKVFCAARGGGIRFSPHFYTPEAQLETATNALGNIITHNNNKL